MGIPFPPRSALRRAPSRVTDPLDSLLIPATPSPNIFAQQSPRMAWARATFKTQTLNTWLCGQDPPYPLDTSPIHIISPQFPPVLVVVATGDELISPTQSYNLVNKLKELGVEASYVEAKGMPHAIAEEGRDTWPEDQDWWNEAILPSLDWVVRMTKG
jgi:acetyl esterase/lipase